MKDKLSDARGRINAADRRIAKLFVKRMRATEDVASYKLEHGLNILDAKREAEVIERNSGLVDKEYRESYVTLLKTMMELSKKHQSGIMTGASATDKNGATVLRMELGEAAYPIYVGKGLLGYAPEYFNLDRRVFIVTDNGVPTEYATAIKEGSKTATVYTVEAGEGSKSMATLESVLNAMSDFGLDRGDCVVAVGGGVVGDLAGFAASVYMRGVDFYNLPTTLLSQVDSSIGGKTAVNLGGVKNSVGSFKQPKAVVIDTDTLKTLPIRHMRNGMCEAVKMAATSDAELFGRIEDLSEEEIYENINDVIVAALKIKKAVVEKDEKESGIRRILNFGHTLGHAVESAEGLGGLLHGECVAIGMMAASGGEAKRRIENVLKKLSLPTSYSAEKDSLIRLIEHDKKALGGVISVVLCEKIGECLVERMSADEFCKIAFNSVDC